MNMFKKSRKAKDQEGALSALSGSDQAPMSKASRALTRKKKKNNEVEEKPNFDLSSVLPGNNDFRTSLLMPNLSARFSMLREQDDPNTKVGKASDDSVLFPKRASRLMLFNHNPLTDIAEVDSIRSGFRPPFADERTGSMSDGYASDDGGSIMNRTRPGEGNNLFGGRQKLYKIAAASSKNLPGEGVMTRGKHTYENDVSLSTFQQMRSREKEERLQQEFDERTDRSSFPNTDIEEQGSTRSPLTAFSQNRGTHSSTNSGPSNRRTSTAATSVISDSPLPQQSSNTAISKVKEQDANSSAESIGFANSPSFRKIREARSAANMRDHHSRQSPVPSSYTFRGMSPPLSATSQPLDFGLGDITQSQNVPTRFRAASPTSQFELDQDETLAGNVSPNDRGKATALGMFNKPARQYDDAQFQQRQMQIHEGRNSPLSMSSRAASRASPEPVRSGRPSYASTDSPMPLDDNSVPQIPPIPDYPPSPVSNRRSSANSTGRRSSSRPRTKSSASTKETSVKARVESLIKRQNAELAALEATHLGTPRHAEVDPTASPNRHNKETFFDNSDDSDDDNEASQRQPSTRSIDNEVLQPSPPCDIHPALREGLQEFDFSGESGRPSYPRDSNHSAISKVRPSADKNGSFGHDSVPIVEDVDSPTIPTAGLGLSGLIRTHLRQDSDKSSMLAPPSPALPSEALRMSISSTTRTVTGSVKSDPFEYDNDRLSVHRTSNPGPPTPTTAMSFNAQHILDTAKALRDAQMKVADTTPKVGTPFHPENNNDAPMMTRMDLPSHQRNESTETQKEQQRFDEELAERRKRIQEGLKGVQERSRSRSPIAERNVASSGHGFSLPRFPGRSNTGDRAEPQVQSKAMKMLGMSSVPREHPSPRFGQDHSAADTDRLRDMHSRQGQRPPIAQDGKFSPNSGRPGPGRHDRPPPPRSTTPSSRPDMRSRSNSAAADRSASRNRHVPDFDRSMMPGGFPASPYTNASPYNDFGQRSESPADRAWERPGFSAAGNYFNAKPLAPPETGNAFMSRPSPRPSPNPISDGHFGSPIPTPMSPSSALPSPNPMTSNGRTTPSAIPGRVTPSGHRKRSVTKGMISEPTFVSTTATVPLVYLPRDGGPNIEPVMAPPVPTMNPRRRGNTGGGESSPNNFNPHPAVRPIAYPLPMMPESPNNPDFSNSSQLAGQPQARTRNKLRKSSSEGGNMAARARQQALMVEMAREKDRSPNVAVFPNKSATSLTMQQGGMI